MSISRSIMRPIMRPIARGIADGIAAAKRYYWLFGGDYASLQAPDSPVPAAVSPSDYSWLPTGTEFNIKLKVDLAAVDMGVQRFMLSDITTSLPRLYKTGSDKLRLQYDSDGVGTIEQITSSSAYSAGDELDIEIQFRPTGTEIFINGDSEGNSSTPAFSPSTLFTLALMGANQSASSRWNGRIWDVLFEDLGDSSNTRSYAIDEGEGTIIKNSLDTGPFSQSRGDCLLANGVDIDADISPIALSGAFTMQFEGVREDSGNTSSIHQFIKSDSTNQTWINIYNSGGANVDRVGLSMAGTSFGLPSAFAGVADGDKYTIELIRDSSDNAILNVPTTGYTSSRSSSALETTITGLFSLPNDNNLMIGAQGRAYISNDATGDTYEWLFNNVQDLGNGQGYVPNTGSVGDVDDTEYATNGDFDTDLTGWNPNGTTSWNAGAAYSATDFRIDQAMTGLSTGDKFKLVLEVSELSGDLFVQLDFGAWETISSTGTIELEGVAPSDNFNIRIADFAGGSPVRVESVSVKKFYVTNGTFDTDLSGWSADPEWVWVDGAARDTGTAAPVIGLRQALGTSAGDLVRISYSISDLSGGTPSVKLDGSTFRAVSVAGDYVDYLIAANNSVLSFEGQNALFSVDSVSVEKLNGALVNNYDPNIDREQVAAQTDFIANTDPNWIEV